MGASAAPGGDQDVDPAAVGRAFGLVILAGACSGLGSVVLLLRQRREVLAYSLAGAAGVMLFIALVELWAVSA